MIKYGNKSSTSKVSRRFVKRTARRVPRPIRTTGVSMRVEFDEIIYVSLGDTQPVFSLSGNSYVNFSAILLANPAYLSQATNFMRYKITACMFTATPCFTEDSIKNSYGPSGVPTVFVQQYPILSSISVADEVLYSDNNLQVKPLSLSQSKYWGYKNNFLIGSGQGAGTWNQTNSTATQQGQFSIRTPPVFQAAIATVSLYSVRMCLYVTLDGKSR